MVTIIDYGSGNLRSVQKALERIGVEALISDDPQRVAESERVVLPGVGAFDEAMRELRARGLVEPIVAHVRADKPFFGICMGLQLLFETGWEGGENRGLGLLEGDVARFELPVGMKVPHMGWNTVTWGPAAGRFAQGPGDWYYFVHSYAARPRDPSVVAGVTDYGGEFCAAVARGRLFATQFHPEKSQETGMRLLRAFVDCP